MHELTLTESVLDIVAEEAGRRNVEHVRAVVLEIGALSCAEPEAIRFCFDVQSRGTLAEGARLEIRRAPGEGWCARCARPVAMVERYDACPRCGRTGLRVTSGDAMRVLEMEVE
jgi:hydrogenase nickel incorporation protein HypA/HybF